MYDFALCSVREKHQLALTAVKFRQLLHALFILHCAFVLFCLMFIFMYMRVVFLVLFYFWYFMVNFTLCL